MVNRLVSVGDDFTLPAGVVVANANLPAHVQPAALNATYVTYVDAITGLPLEGKHVIIKVDQSGPTAEIADIVVEGI